MNVTSNVTTPQTNASRTINNSAGFKNIRMMLSKILYFVISFSFLQIGCLK